MLNAKKAHKKESNISSEGEVKRLYLFMWAFIILGIILSFVLTRNYFIHSLTGEITACAISDYIDCDRISSSNYSSILGVPVSSIAIAGYLTIAIVSLQANLKFIKVPRSIILDLIVLLTGLATSIAVVFAVLSVAVVKALCIYCLMLQINTISLFLIAIRIRSKRNIDKQKFVEDFQTVRAMGGSSLLSIGLGGVIAFMVSFGIETGVLSNASLETSLPVRYSVENDFLSDRAFEFSLEKSPTLGSDTAAIQIVVFADYNCPHCRNFDPEIIELAALFPNDIRIIFKFFPLDPFCNSHIPKERLSTSCIAAAAAYSAHLQGKFLDYHNLLFDNFQDHSQETLLANAKEASIPDINKFFSDMEHSSTFMHLQNDIEEGARAGLRGTPTVFVNGRMFETTNLGPGKTAYEGLLEQVQKILRATL